MALCDEEEVLDRVVLVVDLDVPEVRGVKGRDAAVAEVHGLVSGGRDLAAGGAWTALVEGVGTWRAIGQMMGRMACRRANTWVGSQTYGR